MLQISPPCRVQDKWGQGHFGAPRGNRVHMGVDYAMAPGSTVLSPVEGTCTKVGKPYSDDNTLTYVQITDTEFGDRLRFFYVQPIFVRKGSPVHVGDVIGVTQSLNFRYEDITEHMHFEVKDSRGRYLKPEEYLLGHRIQSGA